VLVAVGFTESTALVSNGPELALVPAPEDVANCIVDVLLPVAVRVWPPRIVSPRAWVTDYIVSPYDRMETTHLS